ncbi:hypothetical protein Tdes44962_MAKER09414 [Teratosphaeria destructans]|uniref:Transmembrane protein n=1 Tax=Teratosphaeria destructans TaxID=418781 RepID=A0A9W7W2V8_9PEZI|nr:hypothetical protein Tdes44962_MAKER09414 [Teratosphaeria destructans]
MDDGRWTSQMSSRSADTARRERLQAWSLPSASAANQLPASPDDCTLAAGEAEASGPSPSTTRPAPAPADGPPLSAHALRNRADLPYEIIGIVGAYFAAVFLIGTLLLTVGRSSRKRAIQLSRSHMTEMVKPAGLIYDPSPVSPASGRSWFGSPRKGGRKGASASIRSARSGASEVGSPGMDSVVSFDQSVVEQDRIRREQEMERLYAAVMAQDDRKSAETVAAAEVVQPDVPTLAPPRYQQAHPRPPRLVTDAPGLRHLQTDQRMRSPRSPGPPKSPVRAIYPPDSPLPPMPTSPTSPIRADYPPNIPLSPPMVDRSQHQPAELQPNRASRTSFGSGKTIASTSSSTPAAKKSRRSLRHLKISAPLQSHRDDNSDGARTPLSPRLYTDPGIPPEPPTARTLDSQHAPTTPATVRSWQAEEEQNEGIDQLRDLPRPHLPRIPSNGPPGIPKPATSTTTAVPTNPTSAQPRPLPLRQLAQQQSQSQSQSTTTLPSQPPTEFFPLSPSRWPTTAAATPTATRAHEPAYPLSAGPVKTTFLDVRRDQFSAGPRTGLATPYSPYMPFTPLTPVLTPRLVGRRERRARERERGPEVVEEMVEDEGVVWGSGY